MNASNTLLEINLLWWHKGCWYSTDRHPVKCWLPQLSEATSQRNCLVFSPMPVLKLGLESKTNSWTRCVLKICKFFGILLESRMKKKNWDENWYNIGIVCSHSVLNIPLLAQIEQRLFYSKALQHPCWICSFFRRRLLSTKSIYICPETLSAMSAMPHVFPGQSEWRFCLSRATL